MIHPLNQASIPRVIHQTWKTVDVPPRFLRWQRTWWDRNPGYAYRLWTDDAIAAFVEREFPNLVPLFRGYRDQIARVDLGRYLILARLGGVYADLDCECLRSIESLVHGQQLVIGVEPAEHEQLDKAVHRGLRNILCPSFIASVPGHPFWAHVIAQVAATRDAQDVLDATGPFLLTRAHQTYTAAAPVTVVPAERLYPLSKNDCWTGRSFDLGVWETATRRAAMVHYWEGTWFRDDARLSQLPQQIPVRVTAGASAPPATASRDDAKPLVSCLMVTRDRADLARFAIAAFLRQTYPQRELVIVDDGPDDALARYVEALARPEIRMLRLPDERAPLGELRNRAVDHARGRYVAQWDDDDLSDPQRLECQYHVLRQTGAHACLLGRWMMWWPERQRLAISPARPWEGSLVCEKAVMPRYPTIRRGEDTPVVEQLLRTARVATIDLPRLYTYVVHGANTFDAGHFDVHWQRATARFIGSRYRAVLGEMAKRLPIEAYAQSVRDAKAASLRPARRHASGKVLILTPVKNAVRFLPRSLELLAGLDWDPGRMSVAFLESDSTDGTHAWLEARLPQLRQRYARAEVFRKDYGFRPSGPRWTPGIQRRRREILADARNQLLAAALRDEDHVLWLDADLIDYPATLLSQLIDSGHDIVAPRCELPDGRVFDLNSFRLVPDRTMAEDPRWMIDGIFMPPSGVGRRYLDADLGRDSVPLDGVGGTALLVRADLHREGLRFPSEPYRSYLETEGLAAMAADMGITCYGLPGLRVIHAEV
ncbi:MAG: glycosyltransferase [Planctomycetia bacterium]